MTTDKERAKELFYKFDCNHFYMDKEGQGQRHSELGACWWDELKWRKDFINSWINQLSTEDLRPLHHLQNADAFEALPAILRLADQGDSYSQFWFAMAIQRINKFFVFLPLQIRANKKVKDIYKRLADGPIEITELHKKEITRGMLAAFQAATPEQYIKKYSIRKRLEIT